jgi:hypothetical protein
MQIYHNLIQGSEEWHKVRSGKITGSVVSDLITAKKLELSKSETAQSLYRKTAYELKNDISLNSIFGNFDTWQMKEGRQYEPEAREWFCKQNNCGIDWLEVGFVDSAELFGISPDYLQLDFDEKIISGLEIKCPQSVNGYTELHGIKEGSELRTRKFDYYAQVQLCMYVCMCDYWHFLSYVNKEMRKKGAVNTEFVVEKDTKLFEVFGIIENHFLENY